MKTCIFGTGWWQHAINVLHIRLCDTSLSGKAHYCHLASQAARNKFALYLSWYVIYQALNLSSSRHQIQIDLYTCDKKNAWTHKKCISVKCERCVRICTCNRNEPKSKCYNVLIRPHSVIVSSYAIRNKKYFWRIWINVKDIIACGL